MTVLRLSLLGLLVTVACVAATPAHAQFIADGVDVTIEAPVLATLPHDADTLRITYRPGSQLATTEALPTHGQRTLAWTPVRTGLATLAVDAGPTQNVTIRPATFPLSGLIVLLCAGGFLAGGAWRATRHLIASPPVSD